MFLAASAPVAAQNGARQLTVRDVRIEGNRAIDDFTLRASIETTASAWLARFPLTRWVGWGRRPAFDETEFRRDVLRLLVLYRQTGYIDARVDTVVVRGRDHVDIRFSITEGEPVRVTSLSVRGTEGIIPPAQLIRDLPLREGDPFDQGRLILSTDSIRLALQNRGHPFPTVYRGFSVQYAERTADVEFLVDPGPAARIDSIEVIGPPDLDPTLVRKTIRLQPGQRFNQTALYQSQQELYRMGRWPLQATGPRERGGRPLESDGRVRNRLPQRAGLGRIVVRRSHRSLAPYVAPTQRNTRRSSPVN